MFGDRSVDDTCVQLDVLASGDFEGILKDIYQHVQMIVSSFCLDDYKLEPWLVYPYIK
jgi:hypothetical protein